MANVWRDRRLVYVMSTNSDPTTPTSVQRKERDGTATTITCPTNVVAYNKYMGGVDHADQLRNYHHIRCKSRKFYKYLFWFAFDSAVVNAYILWKNYKPQTEVSTRQLSIKQFRLALAKGLIGNYNSRKRYAVPTPIKEASLGNTCPARKRQRISSASEPHFPIKGNRGKCAYCWNTRGERHETNVRCRQCGMVLCVDSRDPPGPSCFELYHLQQH